MRLAPKCWQMLVFLRLETHFNTQFVRMKTLIIVPARFASTRFPAKMLALLDGKPVIQHTYERALRANADKVVVATDHESIYELIENIGGTAVRTSDAHPSGTDRCADALQQLQARGECYDVVINVQGDEVFIDPQQINALIDVFQHDFANIATLIRPIQDAALITNPNIVKVVTDVHLPNQPTIAPARYFSRSPIPFVRNEKDVQQWAQHTPFYKHVGMYGFRAQTLLELVKLPVAPLELAEMLEQLRWLQHGYTIYTQQTDRENIGIDTPEDLVAAEKWLRS